MHQDNVKKMLLMFCFNPREGREMHLVLVVLEDCSFYVSIPVRGARCIYTDMVHFQNLFVFQSP